MFGPSIGGASWTSMSYIPALSTSILQKFGEQSCKFHANLVEFVLKVNRESDLLRQAHRRGE